MHDYVHGWFGFTRISALAISRGQPQREFPPGATSQSLQIEVSSFDL